MRLPWVVEVNIGGFTHEGAAYGLEDWEIYLHLATNGRLIVMVPHDFAIYYVMPHSMLQEVKSDNYEELIVNPYTIPSPILKIPTIWLKKLKLVAEIWFIKGYNGLKSC